MTGEGAPPRDATAAFDSGKLVGVRSGDSEASAERLRVALELFAAAEDIQRQNLRRRFPRESRDRIERRLETWRCARPGAEAGDAAGTPVPWPRRQP